MSSRTIAFALSGLAAVAGLAAACTVSSNPCRGTPPSLVGTYGLFSYTTAGGTTTLAPPASGSLRFHTSTYGYTVTLPGPVVIADSGTYTQCGSSEFTETSVSAGVPPFNGLYSFYGDTLVITGTLGSTAPANVWVFQH